MLPGHPTVEAVGADSLYVESRSETFRSVHVEAAGQVAAIASRARAEKLVHVSGIGANATSASPYIRSRGQEKAQYYEHVPRRH